MYSVACEEAKLLGLIAGLDHVDKHAKSSRINRDIGSAVEQFRTACLEVQCLKVEGDSLKYGMPLKTNSKSR